MTIELVPLAPHQPLVGPPRPEFSVFADDRLIGHVCEVEPLRWSWRQPGNPFYAPAAGPSQRDCIDVLERLAALPMPPRRGIPPTLKITHPEVPDDV